MNNKFLTNNFWQLTFVIMLSILFAFNGYAQTEQEVIDRYLNGELEITTQYQKEIITRYNEENVVNVHTFPKPPGSLRVPFFSEDFSGAAGDSMSITPPAGWQNVVNAGGNPSQPWEFYTAAYNPGNAAFVIPSGGGFSGDYVVVNSDRYGSGNTQNTSLITPPINCTGKDWIYLSFSEQFRPFTSSSGTVSVSTDGGTNWTDLLVRTGTAVGYPNPAVETSLLVTQATNQADVRFRFTYSGTFGYWWAIDNVTLEEGTPLNPLVGGNTYPINGISNPPSSFENISSALSYMSINGVTGTGQVILELSSGYAGTEPGPVAIGPIFGTSATLGVTFRPAAGYTATTEIAGGASPNQHAITISGASYITLDGRSGGTGSSRNWTVKVTGSGTTGLGQMAVRLQNNAASMTDITIRNLIMIGEAANVTGAVFQITGVTGNTIQNVTVEDNLITSTATSATDTRGYGLTIAVATNLNNTGLIVRNNDITNFYARGMNLTAAYPQAQYYGNRIYHSVPITQPGTVTEFSGIYYSSTSVNGVGTVIHSNMIYNIQLTNHPVTTTTGVTGIMMFNTPTSGDRIRVYNNMVSIGQNLTGTAATANVFGIRDNSATTNLMDIYYNSVYVGGVAESGANNSAAFRKQLSNNINLSNNIFYNARSNNGGTGTHWGIMVNNTTFTSISNNAYYVSGMDGVLGTTTGTTAGNQSTLGEWQAAIGGDLGSIFVNPNFIDPLSSPPNLRINTTIPTALESGAIIVDGITTDFEGTPRFPNPGYPDDPSNPATAPDIGAHEFAGEPVDISPPIIEYTSLPHTPSTANRSVTATITDPSGVQAGANGPRLYFKKNFDGAYLFDNSPTVSGDDYTFTVNQSALGIAIGDTVYYYFAAQDSAGNAATNPAGGSGVNPPGTVPPDAPDFYQILPSLSGTFTVGTGENYENLAAVSNLLNGNAVVTGNVVFELTANYAGDNTFPIIFSLFSTTDSAFTVTIRPTTGVTNRVTEGDPGSAFSTAVIHFAGARNYILDGRPGGTGGANEWTIRNTRTAATIGGVIRFIDDGAYNTIRNLNLEGGQPTLTTTGVVFFHTSVGTVGNSFNSVLFNNIRPRSGVASISNGILSNGTAAAPNTSNTIIGNHITDFNNIGISVVATGNGPDWVISENHFYNPTHVSASAQTGISIASAGSTNMVVSGNFIGGNAPGATGTLTNSGAGVIVTGIILSNGIANISNNTIANISGTGTGTGARLRGIYVTSGLDGNQLVDNHIYNLSTMSTGTGLGAGVQPVAGISIWTGSTFYTTMITGNTIHNLSADNTFANTVSNVPCGIFLTNVGVESVVSGNRIYDIKNKATGTTAEQPPIASGIFIRFIENAPIINNMISLGTGENTNTQFSGIMVVTGGTPNVNNYLFNSIAITGTAGGDIGSFGILRGDNTVFTPGSTINMFNNAIYVDRIGGGSVNHAVGSQGTTAAVSFNADFNMLFNSNPATLGLLNTTSYDFAGWKTNSSGDGNSLSPSTLNGANLFSNIAAGDLNVLVGNVESWFLNGNGNPLSLVPVDYNGNPRSTSPEDGATDIGAVEFLPTVPPPVIVVPVTALRANNPVVFAGKTIADFNLTTAGSLTEINVQYYTGFNPPLAPDTTKFANVWLNVTPNGGASGYVYDMKLYFNDGLLGTIDNRSNVRMAKSENSGVSYNTYLIPGTGTGEYLLDTVNNTITVHGLNTLSIFTLTDALVPVPVELVSFIANVNGQEIQLSWVTASEINNRGFEIERKLDGEWEKVGYQDGKGTTSSTTNYAFSDKFNYTSYMGAISYRLKQIDFDGSYNYSNAIEVDVDFTPKEYTLYQNYPNPFNPSTVIKYALPFDSNVRVQIYNLLGELVTELVNTVQEVGYYDLNWNAGALASGIYFYTINAKSVDGQHDFNTVKKMMLVK